MLLTLTLGACGEAPDPGVDVTVSAAEGRRAVAALLTREMVRIDSAAAAVDELFRPIPLLRPAQENALRRFPNPSQLARARALGIDRGADTETLARLEGEGRLVRLDDSDFWVVGRLDHSTALVVPGVVTLLEEIGSRFHRRLTELGAPPFRFEISSVLRSETDQAALRLVNPNAALGESTHEYATTVDLLYSAFAAPAEGMLTLDTGAGEAGPFLERYETVAAERVAGRRALELKAVLGEVLLEVQDEGRVMVTLERQQPVFHMTLAAAP